MTINKRLDTFLGGQVDAVIQTHGESEMRRLPWMTEKCEQRSIAKAPTSPS